MAKRCLRADVRGKRDGELTVVVVVAVIVCFGDGLFDTLGEIPVGVR